MTHDPFTSALGDLLAELRVIRASLTAARAEVEELALERRLEAELADLGVDFDELAVHDA